MQELSDILRTKKKMPLAQEAVINLFLSSNKAKDDLLLALKPFDLSLEQFNVLRILRGSNGTPLNLQDIQCRMINKMSNTTRLVDKLIKKDLAQRSICESNRRKVEIHITQNGLDVLGTLDDLIQKTEHNITATLSSQELATLNTLLEKLRT